MLLLNEIDFAVIAHVAGDLGIKTNTYFISSLALFNYFGTQVK
jgi:hypothetical protein